MLLRCNLAGRLDGLLAGALHALAEAAEAAVVGVHAHAHRRDAALDVVEAPAVLPHRLRLTGGRGRRAHLRLRRGSVARELAMHEALSGPKDVLAQARRHSLGGSPQTVKFGAEAAKLQLHRHLLLVQPRLDIVEGRLQLAKPRGRACRDRAEQGLHLLLDSSAALLLRAQAVLQMLHSRCCVPHALRELFKLVELLPLLRLHLHVLGSTLGLRLA
mmetsp:Transcript_161311/g.517869  ORF Transcript_161311/g.517869 Transcript_161311/m.517869 type:complete len:216 (-) Transcript_161311:555-1202(-)